jgi:hypothetical protein
MAQDANEMQAHALATLSPREQPQYTMQEAGWAAKPVWTS